MDRLPPDAQALLDAAADADDPNPAQRRAADGRVRATLAARGVTDLPPLKAPDTREADATSGTQSLPGAVPPAGSGLRASLWASGLAVAVLGTVFVALDADRGTPPDAAMVRHGDVEPTRSERLEPTPPRPGPARDGAPDKTSMGEPEAPSRPTPAHSARPAHPRSERPGRRQANGEHGLAGRAGDARVQAELRLIAAADRAIRDGRARKALGILAEHGRRFKHGFLVAERNALRVLARCKLGERGAQKRAQALRAAEGSVLATRIREACRPDEGAP